MNREQKQEQKQKQKQENLNKIRTELSMVKTKFINPETLDSYDVSNIDELVPVEYHRYYSGFLSGFCSNNVFYCLTKDDFRFFLNSFTKQKRNMNIIKTEKITHIMGILELSDIEQMSYEQIIYLIRTLFESEYEYIYKLPSVIEAISKKVPFYTYLYDYLYELHYFLSIKNKYFIAIIKILKLYSFDSEFIMKIHAYFEFFKMNLKLLNQLINDLYIFKEENIVLEKIAAEYLLETYFQETLKTPISQFYELWRFIIYFANFVIIN
jgi:hypothetical protein